MEITKIKGFVKRNKMAIIGGAIGGLVGGVAAYAYIRGVKDGAKAAVEPVFQETIKWFDKTFDNLHLQELWIKWALENPDKIV